MSDLKFIELNEDKSPKYDFKVTKKSLDEMKNVGVLLNSKVIVIDFDNDNQNETEIMNYLEQNYPTLIVTTDKGKHFYYSKNEKLKISNSIDAITIGGFQCDYKTGHQYVMIKRNGKMRKSNRELTFENLSELPFLMYPVKGTKKLTPINMTGFKEGDGRNTGLFNHLYCIRKKYGEEEIENIANFINEHIFSDPLDEKELNNIIKSVSDYEIKPEKESWMDKAEAVIDELQCVWFENDIMFFDENSNYYSTETKKLEHYIQRKYRNTSNFTTYQITEVIKQMAIILANNKKKYTRDETYILCGQELINIKQEEEPKQNTRTIVTDVIYNYKIMTPTELEEYEKNKKIGWKFLDDISCKNEDVKQVICECLGCMLAPTNRFGKIFIWYGNGANGKSVLVKVMKAIMGNLLTNANILKINDDFGLSRAYKGIANVTDDVGITKIKETGILKSIIDGSTIEVNRKHLEPIDWTPNSQFVMCCNELPQIEDTTKGMIRRLAFIPFDLQLKDDEIDFDLLDKLLGKSLQLNDDEKNDNALRYIMTKAIFAYRQAYTVGHLTKLQKQEDLLNDFKEENKDSIALFYDYLIAQKGNKENFYKWIDKKTFDEMFVEYTRYRGYDDVKDFKEISKRKFLIRFNRKLFTNHPNISKEKASVGGVTFDLYSVS